MRHPLGWTVPFSALVLLSACGGSGDGGEAVLPQLAPATGATLASCVELAGKVAIANTSITAATSVPAGSLTVAGTAVPAHCQVTGKMFQRTSPVDGKAY